MISIKMTGIKEAMNSLDPKKVTTAARMAINEAARQTRTEASGAIREKFNLPSTRVNKELKNLKMATGADLTAVIQAEGRPIGLVNYGATWVRGTRVTTGKMSKTTKRAGKNQGVTVKILKGPVTRLPSAFIARGMRGKTLGAGALQVFQRRGTSRNAPLVNMASITLPSMMNQDRVMQRVIKKAQEVMDRRFNYHLERLLK